MKGTKKVTKTGSPTAQGGEEKWRLKGEVGVRGGEVGLEGGEVEVRLGG